MGHTNGMPIGMKQKVTISIDEGLLTRLDELVQNELVESRSAAIEAAVRQLLVAQAQAEYERNLELLNPEEEQTAAEEGMDDWSEIVSRDKW